jgi:hypothetical protein
MAQAKIKGRSALALFAVFMLASGTSSVLAQTKRKPAKYIVPGNTIVRLRMNEKLTSKTAHVGQTFTTTVVTPVYVKGTEVFPAGAVVHGHVTHVERASRKSNAGSINVAFTSIKIPNGVSHPISGSLASSDSVDNEGEIKGNSSKKRNASFVGRGMVVGGLMNGAAGVATGGLIGAARGLIKKGEEAEISAGTEFNMILNQSVAASAFR